MIIGLSCIYLAGVLFFYDGFIQPGCQKHIAEKFGAAKCTKLRTLGHALWWPIYAPLAILCGMLCVMLKAKP